MTTNQATANTTIEKQAKTKTENRKKVSTYKKKSKKKNRISKIKHPPTNKSLVVTTDDLRTLSHGE